MILVIQDIDTHRGRDYCDGTRHSTNDSKDELP
jgi:hypothetical protein